MRLPRCLVDRLERWALRYAATHEIGFTIGSDEDPYLYRWFVTPWSAGKYDVGNTPRTAWQRFLAKLPNVYIHLFLRSDDDRALHDHPWANCSLILSGAYFEVLPTGTPGSTIMRYRSRGHLTFRRADSPHRIQLLPNGLDRNITPLTLFVTWRKTREWGFHCPQGWRHWRVFTAFDMKGDSARVGRGCG